MTTEVPQESFDQYEQKLLIYLHQRRQRTSVLVGCRDVAEAIDLPASTAYAAALRLEGRGLVKTDQTSDHHDVNSYVYLTKHGVGKAIELLQQPMQAPQEGERPSWPREHKLQVVGLIITAVVAIATILRLLV